MTSDNEIAESAEQLAEAIMELVALRVRTAVALERDRLDVELAELRDEVHAVDEKLDRLRIVGLHSVRVDP